MTDKYKPQTAQSQQQSSRTDHVERCGNCKYYHSESQTMFSLLNDEELHDDDHEAECLRYPPVRGDIRYYGGLVGRRTLSDAFSGPIVNVNGWCGEWKAKP